MKSKSNLQSFIQKCGYSILSLSKALGQNNKKVGELFSAYENGILTEQSDPYFLGVFNFLFTSGNRSLPSIAEGKLRFLLLTEVLAKVDQSEFDDAKLEAHGIIADLQQLLNDLKIPSGKELSRDQYRTIVCELIKNQHDLRPPTTWFGSNVSGNLHYVFLTTRHLHNEIRNITDKRVRWMSIGDPFFFTICIDPKHMQKGISCELWFCEEASIWEKIRQPLEEVGLSFETKITEKGGVRTALCRHFIHRFSLEESGIEKDLSKLLESEIQDTADLIIYTLKPHL